MIALLAALPLLLASQAEGDDEAGQHMEWESLETLVDHDSFIQFFQSPRFHRGNVELRASWAVVWLDRQEASRLSTGEELEGEPPRSEALLAREEREPLEDAEETPVPNIFHEVASSRLSGLAREIYFEGPVELFVEGDRLLLADAIYLDLVDGHGWIANVTATAERRIGRSVQKLLVRADWMRHSADGTLRADSAIVTTGDFEDSSLAISTGDLRIRPTRPDELGEWEFRLRDNRVHLIGGLWLPLPPLTFNTEARGKPILETFGFGDSARLGSFIHATFNREMGSAGETLNEIFKGDPKNYSAHYGLEASFLGSRGVLADVGVDIESEDHYWLDFQFAAIYDDESDRGLVRVDPSERSRWRRWARATGRYVVDPEEWIQLRFSHQSDPGVQAEFFEREFVRYEQRHTDLVWRRASAQNYYSASLRARAESFRTDVEELPELRAHAGATDLARVFGRPLLYRSDSTAGYLRRREGDPRFSETFPDPFGDREVVRAATRQRLSLPFGTGLAGVRAIPFVEGVAAGWDRGALDEDQEAGRAALLLGVTLSTHLWRARPSGATAQLAPFVSFTSDAASAETAAMPVRFDELEDPFTGDVASGGLHSVWQDRTGQHWLDAQVRASYVRDRPGTADGWAPTEVLAGLRTRLGDVPVGVFHDGLYSAEGLGTVYSLTDVGVQLSPDLALEVGHRRSRDEDTGEPFFETASIGGRYRWTEKWEFEGRHEISLFDNTRLQDELILRRYGYDLVLDITFSDRAGEGTSIGFRVEPTIVFHQREAGVVRALDR